eukprot:CCRYP_016681-RA/>CCRYP_016681-RA protein AED:0.37 eAED:0.69 QI:243/0/0.5/1/0/0/2/0/114
MTLNISPSNVHITTKTRLSIARHWNSGDNVVSSIFEAITVGIGRCRCHEGYFERGALAAAEFAALGNEFSRGLVRDCVLSFPVGAAESVVSLIDYGECILKDTSKGWCEKMLWS